MSRERPLPSFTAAGIRNAWHEMNDGRLVIEKQQDVTGIIEENKGSMNQYDERTKWRDTERIASIPLSLWWEMKEKGIDPAKDPAAFDRWLNDPDNRVFRTRPGRV